MKNAVLGIGGGVLAGIAFTEFQKEVSKLGDPIAVVLGVLGIILCVIGIIGTINDLRQ